MTPRALVTAIGATAIGFAVAIGAAAGSSAVTHDSSPVVVVSSDDARVQAYGWSVTTLAGEGSAGAGSRSAA